MGVFSCFAAKPRRRSVEELPSPDHFMVPTGKGVCSSKEAASAVDGGAKQAQPRELQQQATAAPRCDEDVLLERVLAQGIDCITAGGSGISRGALHMCRLTWQQKWLAGSRVGRSLAAGVQHNHILYGAHVCVACSYIGFEAWAWA
jgi:hypothetical protein